ncbi:acyl carrier protein [Chloroflexota bacterium]
MNQLEQEIINIIVEEAAVDKGEINLDSNLYDLGIDSLSTLEILVALETKYDIEISQNRLRNVNTARKIVRIVSGELKKQRK